jgi:cytoskeleton protein RodZ
MVASIAPLGTPAATAPVEFRFNGDSWVQVFGTDGSIVESGLLKAGERRTLQAGAVRSLVLGNAAAVTVTVDGRPVDLTPYTRANVARFTLSSDGSLAPSAP